MISSVLSVVFAILKDNFEAIWGDGCMSDRPLLFWMTGMLHRLMVLKTFSPDPSPSIARPSGTFSAREGNR